jgi:Right handed beta helix region
MLAERERRCWRRPLTAVIVAGAWLGVAASAYALPVCDAMTGDISACCRITQAGNYQFTGTVTATAGGDCIRITVPGVTLDLNGHNLNGVSSAVPPVGTGIHVLARAPGAIVMDSQFITGFATGIENDAAGAVFYSVIVTRSGGNGVVNNGANANFLVVQSSINGQNGFVNEASGALFFLCAALDDGANGIVLKSPAMPAPPATHVRLFIFSSESNAKNGILLRQATADDLTSFSAGADGGDGVLITGGGGNRLFGSSSTVSNKGYGAEIESSNGNLFDDLTASKNGQGGVHVARSNGNSFNRLEALSNTGAGIWLDSASQNAIESGDLCGNTTSGVHIGCWASTLPSGKSCGTAPHSNGNLVMANYPQSNVVGIGIDKGNHHNRLFFNDSVDAQATPCNGANSSYDLEDYNTNCDSNFWFDNAFKTSSPVSPGCIN